MKRRDVLSLGAALGAAAATSSARAALPEQPVTVQFDPHSRSMRATRASTQLWALESGGPHGHTLWNSPQEHCADERGVVHIADAGGHVVRVQPDGQHTVLTNDAWYTPRGICSDGRGGAFMCDTQGNTVWHLPAGRPPRLIATFGLGHTGVNGPRSLARQADGSLWVLDRGNNMLKRISARGQLLERRDMPKGAHRLSTDANGTAVTCRDAETLAVLARPSFLTWGVRA